MSAGSDAFSAELDYLWQAVGDAQDASTRSEKERQEARRHLEEVSARAASLERRLEESLAREKRLKTEGDALREAVQRDSDALSKAAATAKEASALKSEVLRKEGEGKMALAELEALRAQAADLRAALAARDDALNVFREKMEGILSLPEISRAIKEDSAVSGQPASAYEDILQKLERARAGSQKAGAELAAAAEREAGVRKELEAAERELGEARGRVSSGSAELASLRAAFTETSEKLNLSSGEKASLEGRATALKAALSEKEASLESALEDCASLRRQLDGAALEAERLRQASAENAQRTEEQRANFSGAVAQVFELQKRAAALREALKAAQEQNAAVAAALRAREADIEKVNGLLRESKASLAQEKEISKRAALKIKALEAEIDGLKTKITAAADYSSRILKTVQDRDLLIGANKAAMNSDKKRITDLEIENEDLRRKNIKFSGMLKREQTDFTTRMLTSLERSSKDLKTFNLRIPAVQRKTLEPALRNLLASVNLLKGWQEYLDPETPELEDTDLAPFVSGEAGKWERAFKQRKISISAAVMNPRLRARLSPERVKMLFYNLIKNAYERLQPGGSLRITVKTSEDGRLAVMAFEDSGPGFTREALDKLYAPFNTTDKGKAGIGLAVAARIAEKHGGSIDVANKKERGAIVTVRLPLGG